MVTGLIYLAIVPVPLHLASNRDTIRELGELVLPINDIAFNDEEQSID